MDSDLEPVATASWRAHTWLIWELSLQLESSSTVKKDLVARTRQNCSVGQNSDSRSTMRMVTPLTLRINTWPSMDYSLPLVCFSLVILAVNSLMVLS